MHNTVPILTVKLENILLTYLIIDIVLLGIFKMLVYLQFKRFPVLHSFCKGTARDRTVTLRMV